MAEGIKETQELMGAIGVLTKSVVKELKNGFQGSDIFRIGGDVIKNSKEIAAGFRGIGKVKEELKDLDPVEAKNYFVS